MIEKWQQNDYIVLVWRSDCSKNGHLKRKSAELFNRLHTKISTPKIKENVVGVRLTPINTVNNINRPVELNIFMKGIFGWAGEHFHVIVYTHVERIFSTTKFNAWLCNHALEGTNIFSAFSLKIWDYIKIIISGLYLLYVGWIIVDKIILGGAVRDYPYLHVSIIFLGSIQLIGNGVLNETIGRAGFEFKNKIYYTTKEEDNNEC